MFSIAAGCDKVPSVFDDPRLAGTETTTVPRLFDDRVNPFVQSTNPHEFAVSRLGQLTTLKDTALAQLRGLQQSDPETFGPEEQTYWRCVFDALRLEIGAYDAEIMRYMDYLYRK